MYTVDSYLCVFNTVKYNLKYPGTTLFVMLFIKLTVLDVSLDRKFETICICRRYSSLAAAKSGFDNTVKA